MATLTHYFPWDHSDEFAYCGHRMTARDTHSPQPTCLACAARQAAEDVTADEAEDAAVDAAIDAEVENAAAVPLDAEEAALAGLGTRSQMSSLGADLFAFAVGLNRALAQVRR